MPLIRAKPTFMMRIPRTNYGTGGITMLDASNKSYGYDASILLDYILSLMGRDEMKSRFLTKAIKKKRKEFKPYKKYEEGD